MGIKLKVNTNLNNNTVISDSRLKLLCKLYSSLFIGLKLLKTFLSSLQIFQLYVVVVKL